jgi:integrase
LEALAAPRAGRATYYDQTVRDLGLRVEASGKKRFFWCKKIQGSPTFRSIGLFPATDIAAARGAAMRFSGALDRLKRDDYQGPSPFERARGVPRFKELVENYISRHTRGHTQRPEEAERDVRECVQRYMASWSERKLTAIHRKDVLDLHARVGEKHPTTANRVIQLLRAAYNFAQASEFWRGENPAAKIQLFHEKKRTRFVQPDEMPRLLAGLQKEKNKNFVDFVLLSLWCGARKNDILSMRWQELSLEDFRWNVSDPKGAESYQVALVPEAVEILRRRKAAGTDETWVFPSWSGRGHVIDYKRAWRLLLKRVGLENLRQHDLRRTFGSWQAGLGSSLPIIGKSLGHKSQSATSVYSQLILSPVRTSATNAVKAMLTAGKLPPA